MKLLLILASIFMVSTGFAQNEAGLKLLKNLTKYAQPIADTVRLEERRTLAPPTTIAVVP